MYKSFEIGLKDVIPSVVPPRLLVEDKSGGAEPRNLIKKTDFSTSFTAFGGFTLVEMTNRNENLV
jgi:hypothetical protein